MFSCQKVKKHKKLRKGAFPYQCFRVHVQIDANSNHPRKDQWRTFQFLKKISFHFHSLFFACFQVYLFQFLKSQPPKSTQKPISFCATFSLDLVYFKYSIYFLAASCFYPQKMSHHSQFKEEHDFSKLIEQLFRKFFLYSSSGAKFLYFLKR